MVRFVADEDFNGRIVRGLMLRRPDIDLVRVQDIGLSGTLDPVLLAWADANTRIVLSHDGRTMPRHATQRLSEGLHFPGLFIVDDMAPIGVCIEDIVILHDCSKDDEWRDQIWHLPLK